MHHVDTAILERTPATLDALLRGLPDVAVRTNEGGDTWSAFDVLGHLIHGEQTDWIARVLARPYGDSVGPWRAYLRIISGQPG